MQISDLQRLILISCIYIISELRNSIFFARVFILSSIIAVKKNGCDSELSVHSCYFKAVFKGLEEISFIVNL